MLIFKVGGFGVARLGNTAIKGADNERYFYDGLVALIDLSLRRFVATARETEADAISDAIPVLNPVAFHWWYEGEKGRYEDLCQSLKLPAFANATTNIYTERLPSTILDEFSAQSQQARSHDGSHDNNNNVDYANSESGSNSPDKSTDFILHNAQRLAKYMSCNKETYLQSFEGDKEKHDMAKLASRILNGTSSQEELLTAPTDAVYMIVEMLLLDSRSKQGVKRKRASGNEQDKRSDGPSFHHDSRQPVSPVDLLDQNTSGQAAPLTGGMDISQGLPPLDPQFPPGFFGMPSQFKYILMHPNLDRNCGRLTFRQISISKAWMRMIVFRNSTRNFLSIGRTSWLWIPLERKVPPVVASSCKSSLP